MSFFGVRPGAPSPARSGSFPWHSPQQTGHVNFLPLHPPTLSAPAPVLQSLFPKTYLQFSLAKFITRHLSLARTSNNLPRSSPGPANQLISSVLIVFPSSLPSTSPLFSSSPPNVLIYRRILTVKTEPALIYLFISPPLPTTHQRYHRLPSSRPKYPQPLDLDATSVDRIHPSYFWPMLCYKLITPRPYIVSLPTSRPPVYHSPELDIRYPWG